MTPLSSRPPRVLPGRPSPGGPGPTPLAPAQATYQAQLAATLARAVANSERYLRALRVPDAATHAARQQLASRPDAVRRTQLDTLALAGHARYAARLTTQPYAIIRPGLTPQEKLWLHVVSTMPYELALMTRIDPVTRAVGGAVVVVGTVQAAPLAYTAAEDMALAGLENSAALLENNGAAIAAHLRAVTINSFLLKGSINAVGQGVGNYIIKRDAVQAVANINLLSVAASGLSVPLGYNSLFSAGFSFTLEKKFKPVATGDVSAQTNRTMRVAGRYGRVVRLNRYRPIPGVFVSS